MADNVTINTLSGSPKAAADEVTFSGDTAQIQLMHPVMVSGSEGSKTVSEVFAAAGSPSANVLSMQGVTSGTPVTANRLDPAATTGSITVVDSATTTASNGISQSITTGTPTASSSVSCTVTGHSTVTVQLSGTASSTCSFERSIDGGTTYTTFSLEEVGIGSAVSSLAMSDNKAYIFRGNCGGLTNVRVRCTAYTSGTVSVKIQPSYGPGQLPVNQGIAASAANAWTMDIARQGGTTLVADDGVAAGSPLMIGGVARRARRTAVSADADSVYASMDRYGRQQVVGVDLTVSATQVTASGDTSLVAAPGSGSRLKILRVEGSNSHATTALTAGLKSTSVNGGSVFGKKYLPAVGGMAAWTFPNGHIVCGDNEAFSANLSSAGQVEYTTYYETILT